MSMIYIGAGGWAYFHVPGMDSLTAYAKAFDFVEVNSTFYTTPSIEMVRITKPEGIITIVDYALPENRIGRFLVYHFVKLYEGEYYSKFIKSDLEALLRNSGIEIREKLPILHGTGRILKGIRMNNES